MSTPRWPNTSWTPPLPLPADVDLRARMQRAQYRSRKVFPDPVGVMLAREIETWLDFAWRFGGHLEMAALADVVLRLPNWVEPPTTGGT